MPQVRIPAHCLTSNNRHVRARQLWGTDVYTLDSNLAAAAVHAGLAKPGEAVAVRVRVVQSPIQFTASFRNGVNSNAYGTFASGGYEFVKR